MSDVWVIAQPVHVVSLRRASILVLALMLAVVGSRPSVAAGQAPPAAPFMVAAAIPGETGAYALVPIARFTGSAWVNTWPRPEDGGTPIPSLANIPTSWLGKPVPTTWTLRVGLGVSTKVSVVGTTRSPVGCSSPVALAVARLDGGPTNLSRAPDVGVALDTDQVLEDVHTIQTGDQEWIRLRPAIDQAVRANQDRLVGENSDSRMVEVLPQIDAAPVILEHLSRPASDTSPLIYYFEAVRQAVGRNGATWGVNLRGWIRQDAGGQWSVFDLSGGTFVDDKRWSARPLGLFRLANGVFWVMEIGGYENLAFAIDEVSSAGSRRLVTAEAGGC